MTTLGQHIDFLRTSGGAYHWLWAAYGHCFFYAAYIYMKKNEPQICSQKDERPEGLHVCVDDDEDEGDEEVEEQPDVDHLQVGGVW